MNQIAGVNDGPGDQSIPPNGTDDVPDKSKGLAQSDPAPVISPALAWEQGWVARGNHYDAADNPYGQRDR